MDRILQTMFELNDGFGCCWFTCFKRRVNGSFERG